MFARGRQTLFPLPLRERVHSECQSAFAFLTFDARREAPGYAEAKPSEGG